MLHPLGRRGGGHQADGKVAQFHNDLCHAEIHRTRPRQKLFTKIVASHGDSTELMESLVYPGGNKNSIHVQKPVQQTVLSEKNSSLFGTQNMLSNEPCLQQKKVTTPQDATHP